MKRTVKRTVKRTDIVGAWAYHAWRITYEDGRVTEPSAPMRPGCCSTRTTAS